MTDSVTPTDPAGGGHGRVAELGEKLTRWNPYIGAQLVVAGAILLDVSLPKKITIGLPAVEALLLVGLVMTSPHRRLRPLQVRRRLAIAMIGLVSAVNIFSLILLCHYLLQGRKENGHDLILAGFVLWVTNVLLFGLWYWELDRGGPLARNTVPEEPDFLFPQMSEPKLAAGWSPNLIDYLYVSFTNATAFSPTDAMPLSRGAKLLMATQALTALVTVGLVVARAVNILA
jgi:hypothetical protein